MSKEPQPLPQVVGHNARRLRGDHTLENVATYARDIGVKWSSGSVSTIELGRSKCTVETLFTLSIVLTLLAERDNRDAPPVTVRDLLKADGEIQLTGSYSVTSEQLLNWLGGTDPGSAFYSPEKITEGIQQATEYFESLNLPPKGLRYFMPSVNADPVTPGENRLAKKAGINTDELRAWSLHLWGKTIEDERDEIAGPDSTPQKKGRVSRDLMRQIETAMSERRGER